MLFDQLDYVNEFDGIWACASLLHVSRDDMVNVLCLVKRALKENGTLYLSYKYGTMQREKDGRLFSDYTEETSDRHFVTGRNTRARCLFVCAPWAGSNGGKARVHLGNEEAHS